MTTIQPNHVRCTCGKRFANWSDLFAHHRLAHGTTIGTEPYRPTLAPVPIPQPDAA